MSEVSLSKLNNAYCHFYSGIIPYIVAHICLLEYFWAERREVKLCKNYNLG